MVKCDDLPEWVCLLWRVPLFVRGFIGKQKDNCHLLALKMVLSGFLASLK